MGTLSVKRSRTKAGEPTVQVDVLTKQEMFSALQQEAPGYSVLIPAVTVKKSRTTVGQPTVSLLCSPCYKQGKITKLPEATAKFVDGVSHCTACWSAYGDRLVETEPGIRRYTLR